LTSLALKSLWARKVRALATSFAVVLGIAFVAGSYVLTDTILAAFDEIFNESLKGTSVVVTADNPVKQENGETPSFPATALPQVEKVPGVKLAAGAIFTPGAFFDEEGDAIGAKFAPKFISSVLPGKLESLTYVDGHLPRGPTEASIDKAAADEAGLKLGDELEIAGQGRARGFEIVGLTQLGSASFGGASIAQVTLPVAQGLTHKRGRLDQISIAAADGVSSKALKQRVERAVPRTLKVETAEENAARSSDEIRENLGFLQTFLLVFGFIAVVIASFIIFNTFSITIAQRTREFGMLRTLGAKRRQILSTVLSEALFVGLVGGVVGIFGGYVVAAGLQAVFRAFGADLPSTGLVMETRTIVVSILLALLVTAASALVPALRSTRVPPIAALQNFVPPVGGRRRLVFNLFTAALGVIGVVLIAFGLLKGGEIGPRAGLIAGGAFVLLIFVSLFSARLVPPLARVAGWPVERLRRLTGRLARENSERNPSRTAVTASALMIVLALVTFVTVFAAGLKSTVTSVIDENFVGGLIIQNSDGFSPIPAGGAPAAAKAPGVAGIATIRSTQAKPVGGGGGTTQVTAPSPNVEASAEFEWVDGGPQVLRDLGDGEAIVSESFASEYGVAVGDPLRLLGQTGARPRFTVAGIFESKADFFGSVMITQAVMAKAFRQTQDRIDFVQLSPGADEARVQALLTAGAKEAFPTAEVLNQGELKKQREDQVNQVVVLFYLLLGFAVIISVLGVANTLALAIHERTRELGMLRAIGMSRRQVRSMVRFEAVITALIGGILGLALGILFAVLLAQPLADEGFKLSLPIDQLVVVLVVAALIGILAAVVPARRASRLDVLESLQYE
jgi:putative ABC transport system permease protein